MVLSGAGAETMARDWTGVVLWRCQSALRPRHKRKNWFVEVFALDRAPDAGAIPAAEVQMQAIRAGGPGGQHVNKTSSAIRATWVAPGGRSYAVVVRDERSQHRNRSIALARLQAIYDADVAEERATAKGAARHLHHQLQRGAPIRTYSGPRFDPV